MPKAQGHIPNLVNGVSQQAPQMRLASQADLVENFHTTLVDGLVPRPRTDHSGKLTSAVAANDFTHFIFRDQNEKYLVRITTAGAVSVWDMAGNAKTVNVTASSYLSGLTNAKTQLKALTIADHTFIVNTSKVVAAGSTFAPTRPYEALITVRSGQYWRWNRIFINGGFASGYKTMSGENWKSNQNIDTVFIASRLYQGLDVGTVPPAGDEGAYLAEHFGSGGFNTGPWSLARYHSTILIRNNSTDFSVGIEDGYGGEATKLAKDVIQRFSDLPTKGNDGFTIKVTGDKSTKSDDYWVRFTKPGGVDANSEGVWRETVRPGARLGLNAQTMPHILRRESDGTFTFAPATWGERKCGDETAVPDPSFVGQTIKQVFFMDGRLGVLTEENYVMSESASFYNFFRTTLLTLLDTDPIDSSASHIKVSLLNHAVPFNEMMLLWTDQTQFRLKGNELLTPRTVSAKPISEFGSLTSVPPVVSGSSIWFASEGRNWATLNEYFVDKAAESASSDAASDHVPRFIPTGVDRLVASTDPDVNLVLLTTTGDQGALYAYKYKYRGQDKIQSAWQRWTYPGSTRVDNVAMDKKIVYMVVTRGANSYIETFLAEEGAVDDDLTYRIALDRSFGSLPASYDAVNDRTTFNAFPYDPTGAKFLVRPGGTQPFGLELTPFSTTSTSATFAGNLMAETLHIGFQYTCRFRFSPFYNRTQEGQAQTDGRLQVMWLTLNYDKSSYFRVEVTCEGRAMIEYPFTALFVGSPETMTDVTVLDHNGRFSVPIMTRNDRAQIEIVNDTWRPCSFSSADWRGIWNPKNRQG